MTHAADHSRKPCREATPESCGDGAMVGADPVAAGDVGKTERQD